jgi:hypothetical protein
MAKKQITPHYFGLKIEFSKKKSIALEIDDTFVGIKKAR